MHLRELFLNEDDRSTAVFAFGRFNPPTIGHQKLLDKVISMTKQVNGKGYVFLSQKQNNKTRSPLWRTGWQTKGDKGQWDNNMARQCGLGKMVE